jgi:hypothetical protein
MLLRSTTNDENEGGTRSEAGASLVRQARS